MTNDFNILKVRTINICYPHNSFEAIVEIRGYGIGYFNIDVYNGETSNIEHLDDGMWSYIVPLDAVDWNGDDDEYYLWLRDDDLELDIFKAIESIWNSNPKWDKSGQWYRVEDWREHR